MHRRHHMRPHRAARSSQLTGRRTNRGHAACLLLASRASLDESGHGLMVHGMLRQQDSTPAVLVPRARMSLAMAARPAGSSHEMEDGHGSTWKSCGRGPDEFCGRRLATPRINVLRLVTLLLFFAAFSRCDQRRSRPSKGRLRL